MRVLEKDILKGMTILDFSHRLPGPLAGLMLTQMGARVIKIEDEVFGDSFEKGLFAEFDPDCFRSWYRSLNEGKEILKLNFKDPASVEKIKKLLMTAQGLIMGLPPKLQEKLKVTAADLETLGLPLAVMEMGASLEGNESMHDLNAMALSGILSLHVHGQEQDIVPPPFLPVSGLAFGQKIAADLLGLVWKAQREKKVIYSTAYLFETCRDLVGALWPQNLRQENKFSFLHNGAFPCYSLYRTKDGQFAALAAVEEKFWLEFAATFAVPLPAPSRFDRGEKSFDIVAQVFKEKTAAEISALIQGRDVCVSVVPA